MVGTKETYEITDEVAYVKAPEDKSKNRDGTFWVASVKVKNTDKWIGWSSSEQFDFPLVKGKTYKFNVYDDGDYTKCYKFEEADASAVKETASVVSYSAGKKEPEENIDDVIYKLQATLSLCKSAVENAYGMSIKDQPGLIQSVNSLFIEANKRWRQ